MVECRPEWKDSKAVKADAGKLRLDLLPYDALTAVADVFTFGATKYDDRNWEKGMPYTRLFASTMRHLFAWMRGETFDPESKKPHLAHAGSCVLMLLAHHLRKIGVDDRPKCE